MNNKILLIEDNEQNRYLATFLLEKSGYSVVPASNGAAGIELGSSFQPKGILLDIQLPGLDGYEVARALRRNASLNDVPIIAVTSYAMAGDREKAMAAGCDGYIEKPIDPETFVSEIEKFFRRGPS